MEHMTTLPNHSHLICHVCKVYATDMPSNVLRHIIANHPEHLTPEERAKFECPVCRQAFVHLHRHYAMKHPEMLPANVRHRFWCDKCQKYFVNLGLHISFVPTSNYPTHPVMCTRSRSLAWSPAASMWLAACQTSRSTFVGLTATLSRTRKIHSILFARDTQSAPAAPSSARSGQPTGAG